ncbi:uncharacterized protein LOC111106495 [Crassostrea virginica]
MIRFGYLAFTLFSACFDVVFSQKPCDGVLGQQFRPDPSDCRVYYLCGQGKDWRLQCGPNTVWSQETGACVPVGSPEDTCTQSNKDPLPPTAPKGDPGARSPGTRHYSPFSESTWRPKCVHGSTKRFPHPTRCAQYYDCGSDPKEDWWGKHLRECPYPTVYDEKVGSCEYYTTVNCGARKMPLDPCDYLAHSCRNAHCSPCHIRYATCAGLPDGINVWRGREKTPFYVVCQAQRVAFHGRCINPEPGKRQIYDGDYHTCGRPVDFEMGLVQHMHRGEIGQSQIVKQIRHTQKVEKVVSEQASQPHSAAGQKQAQQPPSNPHVNQPKANPPPQQNANNNNHQPAAAAPKQQNTPPKTPAPHVNQPQNNQQKQAPSPPSNNAANSPPNQHTPHVNQPKTAAPQGNTQPPSGQQHTQAPVQSASHVNKPPPHPQAPAQHPAPPQQNYQPPAPPQQPYQQPPPQPHQPYQQPPPPQYGPPQGPPQSYGHPNTPPRVPHPQGPSPHVPPQHHINKPPVHQQRPPYAPSQNKSPTQNPNSLQSFIGEIQHKVINQQPNVPQPHPNQPPQYLNVQQTHSTPGLQVVRAKAGRRPSMQHNVQPPVQPMPQMPPRQPPGYHQPAAPSYPHPNQQRQPAYPHVPQHPPSVPHRPPSPPVAGPPVPSGPNPAHHPNMPPTVQRPNTQRPYPVPQPQQPYPIPNRQHSPPAPAPQHPPQRMYPQPIPRAPPSHGPQPIQPRPIGPYPQTQLYNEPATIRQSIGPKSQGNNNHPDTKRYPVPPTQGTKKRREPARSLPIRPVRG